jgi:SpoVK/Ycf46/Vps4 family AAA+-type ATPase
MAALLITDCPHHEEDGLGIENNNEGGGRGSFLKRKQVKILIGLGLAALAVVGLVVLVKKLSSGDDKKKAQYVEEDPNAISDEGIYMLKTNEHTYKERIVQEALVTDKINVHWDDIVGQEAAKAALLQNIVWPIARPDIFKGARAPARGVLLFGPPGTGKTMLARAVATALGANFLAVSSSTFAAKWYGEAERLMKALFDVARERQPAVIFMDEVDAILRSRNDNDHEASRRVKTEFMVQTDGLLADPSVRLLVLGATNRPMDLDEAALRRFERRIRVDLPARQDRAILLQRGIIELPNALNFEDYGHLASEMGDDIYSCSDIRSICRNAAYLPIEQVEDIGTVRAEDIPPITLEHLCTAIQTTRRSTSPELLLAMDAWEEIYGA